MSDENVVTGANTTEAGATSETPAETLVTTEAEAGKEPEQSSEAEFSFDAPEGFEVNPQDMDAFKAIAKEAKLSQPAAKKLMELAVQREAQKLEKHQETIQAWTDSVKADKEIGGDKLADTLAVAKKAVDLGPPELKEFLNSSGLGNHPLFVRWAHTIGKALSEDAIVKGEATSAVGKPFYNNSQMKR